MMTGIMKKQKVAEGEEEEEVEEENMDGIALAILVTGDIEEEGEEEEAGKVEDLVMTTI